MNRRDFIALTAAVSLVPALGQAAATMDYTPGLIQKHLDAGDTVYVDFRTSWCSTCRAMTRRLDLMREGNAAFDENVVFIVVDYDRFGNSELTNRLGVTSRSTHLVLKGEDELGRVYAKSSERAIGGLLNIALEAATS